MHSFLVKALVDVERSEFGFMPFLPSGQKDWLWSLMKDQTPPF